MCLLSILLGEAWKLHSRCLLRLTVLLSYMLPWLSFLAVELSHLGSLCFSGMFADTCLWSVWNCLQCQRLQTAKLLYSNIVGNACNTPKIQTHKHITRQSHSALWLWDLLLSQKITGYIQPSVLMSCFMATKCFYFYVGCKYMFQHSWFLWHSNFWNWFYTKVLEMEI